MYLEDTIRIEEQPEEVFRFFKNLDHHFLKWHPSHIYIEWRKGDSLEKGSVIYFEEWVFGEVRKRKMKLKELIPGQYLEFVPVNLFQRLIMPRITFEMVPLGDKSTLYRSRIQFRADAIGQWIFQKYLDDQKNHMLEEGRNLKKMMENGDII
jgi:hypothetical protein